MQTATWLTSRQLAEAAWALGSRGRLGDDDGEYFCRVLLASRGVRFVPEARIFYRITSSNRLSWIGASDRKKDAMLVSMKLHVQYLRSLQESEPVRNVTSTAPYMQNWLHNFYPERPDIVAELQDLATQLQGRLDVPSLRWKYAWMKPIFGWKAAKKAQMALPQLKASLVGRWDKATVYVGNPRKPRLSSSASTIRRPKRLAMEQMQTLVRPFRASR